MLSGCGSKGQGMLSRDWEVGIEARDDEAIVGRGERLACRENRPIEGRGIDSAQEEVADDRFVHEMWVVVPNVWHQRRA